MKVRAYINKGKKIEEGVLKIKNDTEIRVECQE
jgi:hypothetical protein